MVFVAQRQVIEGVGQNARLCCKIGNSAMNPRQHPFHLRFAQTAIFPSKVEASITIDAPIEDVWQALVDFPQYGAWNPFTPIVETDLQVGSPITLHVDMPARSKSVRAEWVNLVEPGKTICWGMHMAAPWLLCANRWQELTPLQGGGTRYTTTDYFSGLLAPLVLLFYGEPMRKGFQSVADGLKAHVENAQPSPHTGSIISEGSS
jgi:hypothetical protein